MDSLFTEVTGFMSATLLKNGSVMGVFLLNFSAGIYQFKINNGNNSIMCEICSKSITKAVRTTTSFTLFW